jgi:tRNA-dihydrouridine synthase
MSYEIKYYQKKVNIIYSGKVRKVELTNAFIEMTENANIMKLELIVHDFSLVSNFESKNMEDFSKKAKTLTQFSTNWNADIKVAAISNNEKIRSLFTEIIEIRDIVIWEHFLFYNIKEMKKWEVNSIKQA